MRVMWEDKPYQSFKVEQKFAKWEVKGFAAHTPLNTFTSLPIPSAIQTSYRTKEAAEAVCNLLTQLFTGLYEGEAEALIRKPEGMYG